jgi:hypothetical protein
MRHISPCQPIDARVSSEVVVFDDLGQDPVEAPREVVADLPDLLVYDVKVVEEPLLGLRDLTLLSSRLDNAPVSSEKDLSVLLDAREESASLRTFIGDGLGRGQALGVLHEPFDAEHFGADRRLHSRWIRGHGVSGVHWEFCVTTLKRVNSIK